MSGSLVADLGISPEVWLFLSLLALLTLFFKFSRFWSVRNLDLLLLFALAPGMMRLVGSSGSQPWSAFAWLFVGSAFWLFRCLIDLGLTRRPLLEPNLNSAGLACLAFGVMGLLVAETVSLPVSEGAARNPADPRSKSGVDEEPPPPGSVGRNAPLSKALRNAPLPASLKRKETHVIVSRVLASIAHLALVYGLIVIGKRHFERPITGFAVATCYLLSPYTRMALVDSGQVLPAALIVAALAHYTKPAVAGVLIGLAGGWMPPCLGLIPLWAGFYRGRGAWRFLASSLAVVGLCILLAGQVEGLPDWARALGARSLSQAGLHFWGASPRAPSFWTGIDPSYRLPVLMAYLALVAATTFLPVEKDLGSLIALSAGLLVASQFWYLDEGGTLVLLYLPLILLMMFRPNLTAKRPGLRPSRSSKAQTTPVFLD